MRLLPALLVGLLVAPAAQAALFTSDQSFAADLPYAGANAKAVGILSGALQLTATDADAAVILSNTTAFAITGITQACWTADNNVAACQQGAFTLKVATGAAFGFQSPKSFPVQYSAPQGLAVPADGQFKQNVAAAGKGFQVDSGHAIVAASHVGTFHPLGALDLPATSLQAIGQSNSLGVSGISPSAHYELWSGATKVASFSGLSKSALLQGRLAMEDSHPSVVVLPSDGGLSFGLEPANQLDLTTLILTLKDGVSAFGGPVPLPNLGALGTLLSGFAQRLVIRMTTGQNLTASQVLHSIQVVRYEQATVTPTMVGMTVAGSGPLVVQDGTILGAQPLAGISYFQLPWWSYILWFFALAAWITRLALNKKLPKPAQTRWHKLRWIGLVAGPLAFILLFWLWDIEVQGIFGLSLLGTLFSGHLDGGVLLGLLAIEVAPFMLMLFAVASPIRLLANSLFRLFKQGKFMNLGGTIAYLLAIVLGSGLLLTYLDYALRQAAG